MELSDIRAKIDTVDDQLLNLFLERMRLSEEVAAYKTSITCPFSTSSGNGRFWPRSRNRPGTRNAMPTTSSPRFFELARSRQAELINAPHSGGRPGATVLAAGGEVFPQTGLVACQGVEGAYSQVACDRLLPRGKIVYVKSFEAVFSAVESGLCKFGVVPIENSSNGSVRAVYDLVQRKNFSIVRSTRLYIHHELLVQPGVKAHGYHRDLFP